MILAATSDGIRDVETGEVALAGRDVTHLVAAANGVWALADHQDVLHAAAPGGWRPIARTEKPTARCVLPRGDGTLFVGTAGAHVLRWSRDGLRRLRSFDAVPGRDRWKNPAARAPDVWSLASTGESVLVGVHVGGVWRSEDEGETWKASLEPETDVHQVVATSAGVVAVAAQRGFGWSRDAGRSWSWTTKGLHASYLQAVAIAGGSVFVGASSGPFSEDAGVYRADVVGGPFTRCAKGLPEWFEANVRPHHLAAAGDHVAIGMERDVYASHDAGRSWKLVASGLASIRAVVIA